MSKNKDNKSLYVEEVRVEEPKQDAEHVPSEEAPKKIIIVDEVKQI